MSIVVSLTTISGRLAFLDKVLESLLAQSLRPDRIHLWISPEPHLLDEGVRETDLPPKVRSLARSSGRRILIRETPNIGPHRRTLAPLHYYRRSLFPPMIATADDDTLYPTHWLKSLADASRRYHAAAVFRARIITAEGGQVIPYRQWPLHKGDSISLSPSLFPTFKDGLAFHPRMLDKRVYTSAHCDVCPSRSDAWLTAALKARGTPIVRLPLSLLSPEETRHAARSTLPEIYGREQPSLWRYNQPSNDRMIEDTFRFFGLDLAVLARPASAVPV